MSISCDNTPNMMNLADAIQKLVTTVPITQKKTLVNLDNALDKILAENVVSPIDVPGYDNSAMDGYAFITQDLASSTCLKQVGTAFAGNPFQGTVRNGQCVRIMTGAQIPDGADTVIMQEKTTKLADDVIQFNASVKTHNNIRNRGEDIHTGQIILQKGKRLNPTDIGLLASIGIAEVSVYQTLNVAIFSTGDELRTPDQDLAPSCIYDSNRYAIKAMLQRLNVNIMDLGIIKDCPQLLKKAFLNAAVHSDIIISSGGVSVGEADYTKEILDEIGHIAFWKIAIKPGKPFAFGFINTRDNNTQDKKTIQKKSVFFGLPGNPVSAMTTFHQLSLPAIRTMAGEIFTPEKLIPAITTSVLKKRPGRTDFQRGKIATTNKAVPAESCKEQLHVETTGQQGSGIFSSMSRADGYIILEKDRGNVASGETIHYLPYDRWIK